VAGTAAVYDLEDAAREHVGVEDGKIANPDLRARITAHKMEARAFQMTIRRAEEEAKSGKGPSAATSVFKYAMAKINQERTELLVETLGTQGLGWEGDGYQPRELQAMRTMLRAKGNSIEGGTSEVNLNVVSKRVLGLLDHQ
jgi:alkylation response protein AidB-like acyl-CoA dehydrogenase